MKDKDYPLVKVQFSTFNELVKEAGSRAQFVDKKVGKKEYIRCLFFLNTVFEPILRFKK